jgi:hypothetical protein
MDAGLVFLRPDHELAFPSFVFPPSTVTAVTLFDQMP